MASTLFNTIFPSPPKRRLSCFHFSTTADDLAVDLADADGNAAILDLEDGGTGEGVIAAVLDFDFDLDFDDPRDVGGGVLDDIAACLVFLDLPAQLKQPTLDQT